MDFIWTILFMVIGLVYIVRGYLIRTHKRTKMMPGIYMLTPAQQEAMIPIVAPYYMTTGALLLVGPFIQLILGYMTWIIILIYLFVGALRISKKREAFIKQSQKKF